MFHSSPSQPSTVTVKKLRPHPTCTMIPGAPLSTRLCAGNEFDYAPANVSPPLLSPSLPPYSNTPSLKEFTAKVKGRSLPFTADSSD